MAICMCRMIWRRLKYRIIDFPVDNEWIQEDDREKVYQQENVKT